MEGMPSLEVDKPREQTLVLVKPGNEALLPLIMEELQMEGLTLSAIDVLQPTREQIEKLYYENKERQDFDQVVDYMTGDVVYAFLVEGEEAIKKTLEVKGKGCTSGIRGRYSEDIIRNVMHSSANEEEAKRDIELFFDRRN